MDLPVALAPPSYDGAADPSYDGAAALSLLRDRPIVALTGAGLSTDSGIPDYRGPGSPTRTPMTYQEFCSGPAARQRYWARSHVGWSRMARALPNPGHHALARLEAAGRTRMLITQNVDGLHEAAGSTRMCALHGRIAEVVCLSCGQVSSRESLHERLSDLNPGFADAHRDAVTRPDGDVELGSSDGFVVPGCVFCDGVLKPHVVFFGENVPKPRVLGCYQAVASAAAEGGVLLVVGSSLTVMSGLRFVRHAHKLEMPIVIVNRGATRGDPLASYKLDMGTAPFLTELSAEAAKARRPYDGGQEMSRRTESTTPSAASTSA